MNIVPIVKAVTGLATSIGAGAVVGNAIKATTPIVLSRTQKVIVGIGGVTVSAAVASFTADYVENSIDEVVAGFRAGKLLKKEFKAAAEEAATETPEESN